MNAKQFIDEQHLKQLEEYQDSINPVHLKQIVKQVAKATAEMLQENVANVNLAYEYQPDGSHKQATKIKRSTLNRWFNNIIKECEGSE